MTETIDLAAKAEAALRTGEFVSFNTALKRHRLSDPFSVVLAPAISAGLTRQLGGRNVVDWILRPSTWDVLCYTADRVLSPAETLLHLLWQDLATRLIVKLEAAFKEVMLANEGAILCFFSGAALSVIVSYRRSTGGALSLRPIAVSERPEGVFDLPHLLEGASPEQRNWIKAAALSPDKLIFQRGILIHVNRQREDVFGPAIDTILLGETLAQWLEEAPLGSSLSALEVGCGSGLLSTLLVTSENVSHLYAVDMNRLAVVCTLKNLQINDLRLDVNSPEIEVRGARFRQRDLVRPIDLIVCNPPYVPEPPRPNRVTSGGHHLAVSGLELCADLLCGLGSLLSRTGRLLLMASSASMKEVLSLVPPEFAVLSTIDGKGQRVPLDVEDVWRLREWQEQLLKEERIEVDSEGTLWHHIQPLWISRKEGTLGG